MAGLGRRTHYRKHLTDQVLFDLPVPDEETDQVGKIIATRGSNQFDVLLSHGTNSQVLAILPTKYRKLVWLKRNDFVIVESGVGRDEAEIQDTSYEQRTMDVPTTIDNCATGGGGIRYMIKHILYKEQIRNLIEKGLWPSKNPEFQTEQSSAMPSGNDKTAMAKPLPTNSVDGIVYEADFNEEAEEDDNDADLFINTNRIAVLQLEDSSSSENDQEPS